MVVAIWERGDELGLGFERGILPFTETKIERECVLG